MDASVSPDRCANGNFVNVINLRAGTCTKHIFCCLCSICQIILRVPFMSEGSSSAEWDRGGQGDVFVFFFGNVLIILWIQTWRDILLQNHHTSFLGYPRLQTWTVYNLNWAFVHWIQTLSLSWRRSLCSGKVNYSLQHLSVSAKHNKMWSAITAQCWTLISVGWRTQVQHSCSQFSSPD